MTISSAICIGVVTGALGTPLAFAVDYTLAYRIGVTGVSENAHRIVVRSTPPVTVAILPGGATWPRMSLDDTGRIYAGNIVINAATTGRAITRAGATLALPYGVTIEETGRGYRFRRGASTCRLSLAQLGLGTHRTARDTLKYNNVSFASSPFVLMALATQFGPNGRVANYAIQQIDIGRCRIEGKHDLGNPDLLIELNYSTQGGWWITGSIEQTLLQSTDGRHWRKAALPDGLSSLVSSYVANPRETWLAAILPAEEESPYLLVYSGDGGRSWRNVRAGDPVLARMPRGWLEGQKRRAPR